MSGKVLKFVLGVGLIVAGFFVPGVGQLLQAAGLALIASAIGPSLPDQNQKFQLNTVTSTNPVPIIYGRTLTGLQLVDVRTSSNRKWLYIVGTLSEASIDGGGIEAIEEIYVDGRLAVAATSPTGFWTTSDVQAPFVGKIVYAKMLGEGGQDVIPRLNALFPSAWPSTSRGEGLAYLAMAFQFDPELFSGQPQITAVVKGQKVWDPRDDTTAYSTNPALCALDYQRRRTGGAVPDEEIDLQTFIDGADYSDELVATPEGSVPRFVCDGLLDTGRPVQENLRNILSGARGNIVYESGLFRLLIRKQETPTGFVIDEHNMVGDIAWQMPGLRDGANAVDVRYVEEDANWQVEVLQYPRPGGENPYLAEDNEFPKTLTLDLPFTKNPYTALQVARTSLLEAREGDQLAVTLKEEALELQVGDLIEVDAAVLDEPDDVPFWITELAILQTGMLQASLLRYHAAAYDESEISGGAVVPAPPAPALPDASEVFDPTNLALTAALSCISPTTGQAVITVSFTEAEGSVGHYEAQWREDSVPGAWNSLPNVEPVEDTRAEDSTDPPPTNTFDFTLAPPPSKDIRVRIRTVNTFGFPGNWVEAVIDLSANPPRTAPPDGSQITAGDIAITQSAGTVQLVVDATGTNGTIFRLHVSATSGFTAGAGNLVGVVFGTAGPGISFQFVPPVGFEETFYYRICVGDCLTEALGEAFSCSAEFSAVYAGIPTDDPALPGGGAGAASKCEFSYKSANRDLGAFAWKGNRFTPYHDIILHSLGFFGDVLANSTYQAAVVTLDGSGNVATIVKSIAFTVPGSAAQEDGIHLWLPFDPPVRLTAGIEYGLMVGRTDGADTYALPVPMDGGTTQEKTVPMAGRSHGRNIEIAKANPAVSDAATTGTTNSVSMGFVWTDIVEGAELPAAPPGIEGVDPPVEVAHEVNGAWTDVDLTGIVPPGSTGVILQVVNTSTGGSSDGAGGDDGIEWGVRKNGSTSDIRGRLSGSNQVTAAGGHTWVAVGLDENLIFELYLQTASFFEVYVVGSLGSNAVFFTDAIDVTPPLTTDTWHSIDLSSQTGSDVAKLGFFLVKNRCDCRVPWALRPAGSTDERKPRLWDLHLLGGMMVLSAAEVVEMWRGANDQADLYFLGYLKGGFVSAGLNGVNVSDDTTGAYTDIDLSGQVGAGATGVFLHAFDDNFERRWAIRKDGQTLDLFKRVRLHQYLWVPVDANRVIEQKIEDALQDLYLLGHTTS